MAKIAILIWPEPGHINPTLKLAMDLIRRRHEVVYLGASSVAGYFESFDLPFISIEPDQSLMDDYNEILIKYNRYRKFKLLFRLFYGRTIAHKHYRIFSDLYKEKFHKLITTKKFDLFMYDSLYSFMGLIFSYYKLPCLQFTSDMPRRYDPIVPPPFSHIIPKDNRLLLSKIKFRWFFYFLIVFIKRQTYKIIGGHFTYRQSSPGLIRLIIELSKEYNFKNLRINFLTYLTPLIEDIPEIVFYPQEFDFTRKNLKNIYWIGPSIAFHRQKIDFPWNQLARTKVLIYCSLGTQTWRIKKKSEKIFRIVIETFKYLPDCQLVLVCGQSSATIESKFKLSNVIIVENAPQLELLKRSKLVITNAGFNTLKECIYYGAPIIAIPLRADQPRNAALIEYHNLGVRCFAKKMTSRLLSELIKKTMEDPIIHKQCKKFQRMFNEEQKNLDGALLIENMLKIQ